MGYRASGGRAVDLRAGGETRAHADLDVAPLQGEPVAGRRLVDESEPGAPPGAWQGRVHRLQQGTVRLALAFLAPRRHGRHLHALTDGRRQ